MNWTNLKRKLKYTKAYQLYLRLRHPDYVRHKQIEIDFYRQLVGPCELILDIGANHGNKADIFIHFAERVVCCEPDAYSQQVLTERFGNKITLVGKAVGDKQDTLTFFVSEPGSPLNTLSKKWSDINRNIDVNIHANSSYDVDVTTLDILIKEYGKPKFVKIDVEGYEEQVLKGLSQAVDLISVESNLPAFLEETIRCINHLSLINPDTLFNFIKDDSYKFMIDDWVLADTFKNHIRKHNSYCEIFAKM